MTTQTAPAAVSVFGALVSGADVEDYLQAVLERWYPSYLWEIERHTHTTPGALALPRSIVRSSAVEKMPEDQTPALIIASPGLTDPPVADGAGFYTATWQVNLAVQVIAAPNRRAIELARGYALALRACVIQQQQDPAVTDAPPMVRIDWRDERYDILDSVDDRTVCVATVEVAVTAAMVLQRGQGPLDPVIGPQGGPGPDSPSWPPAQTVIVDVERDDGTTLPTEPLPTEPPDTTGPPLTQQSASLPFTAL